MRRLLLTSASLLAMLTIAVTPLPAQTPASPTTLAQLRDNFRPLLLFAPNPDDPSLLAQLHELKDDAPGLTSRQVLLIAIPFNNPSPTDVTLAPADALAARRRFHVPPGDFTAILLGKDGGEKLRSARPLSFAKLRDTIDAMPMRQQEMHPHPSH